MACDKGQALQDSFDRAVKARIAAEQLGRFTLKSKSARVDEAVALSARAFHLHNCSDCWENPPRTNVALQGLATSTASVFSDMK